MSQTEVMSQAKQLQLAKSNCLGLTVVASSKYLISINSLTRYLKVMKLIVECQIKVMNKLVEVVEIL